MHPSVPSYTAPGMMTDDASSFRSRILDATRLAYVLASTRSIARVVIDRLRDARARRALGDDARVDIIDIGSLHAAGTK